MVTAILTGRGGELDRVQFKTRESIWTTSDDLAKAIRENNDGHPWTLGDGDIISIIDDDA